MRYTLTAFMLAGILATSGLAFAQAAKPSSNSAAKSAAAKPAAAATHSVQGVVKSVDASSLVITKSGKKGGDMTFKLDSTTQRDGSITTGSPVVVIEWMVAPWWQRPSMPRRRRRRRPPSNEPGGAGGLMPEAPLHCLRGPAEAGHDGNRWRRMRRLCAAWAIVLLRAVRSRRSCLRSEDGSCACSRSRAVGSPVRRHQCPAGHRLERRWRMDSSRATCRRITRRTRLLCRGLRREGVSHQLYHDHVIAARRRRAVGCADHIGLRQSVRVPSPFSSASLRPGSRFWLPRIDYAAVDRRRDRHWLARSQRAGLAMEGLDHLSHARHAERADLQRRAIRQ